MTKTQSLCSALTLALGTLTVWPAPAPAQTDSAASAPAASRPAAKRTGTASAPRRAASTPRRAASAPRTAAQPAARPAASAPRPAASAPAPAAATPPPAAPRPTASTAASEGDGDFIVAIVNTEPVTNNEVRVRLARAERQLSERGLSAPPGELRKDILEQLIGERAQLQYAREMGLTASDAALEQAELAIARQNQLDSVDALHRRVEQEGLAVKDFRDDVRNQVLLSRLREREIEPRLQVTDNEIDTFLREQTGAQIGGMDLNLAMILIAVPEHASAEETEPLRARADEVAQRARAGEDFATLAQEFSDANNRGRDGGVLGLRPANRYPELFVGSTRRARVGDIVGPVKSGAGFHILKVLERKQNNELPEVKIPQTHVRHILLRTSPSQTEQMARERLTDFKRRIETGQTSFEQLAREYSQDDSAREGGDLGWATPGQFVPEFEQTMNRLNAGQISDPVISRFGVHLIRIDARREQVLTAAEQRQMARNVLREKKAQEAFETWAKEVRGRTYVEYREPPK